MFAEVGKDSFLEGKDSFPGEEGSFLGVEDSFLDSHGFLRRGGIQDNQGLLGEGILQGEKFHLEFFYVDDYCDFFKRPPGGPPPPYPPP